MMKIIKQNMTVDNFNTFAMDYNALICIKDTLLWKEVLSLKDNSIFVKAYFDKLDNKYDYIEFRKIIENDKVIHNKIQFTIRDKNLHYADFLLFHYTIEIYISFMIEFILKQEIERNEDIKVISNKYLDVEKKTDLLINGKSYQIKNYSFVENNYYIDRILSEYRKYNKNLLFIFYILKQDNIYFIEIDKELIQEIDKLNAFTVFSPTKERQIIDIINAVSAL